MLDIGCGWGGTALYLHKVAGVDVLGITLSEEQLKVARQRAEEAGVADHVRFELIDYRHVEGRFDRIVSVGMFEHVGAAHYEEFFRKCRDLLSRRRRDAAPHHRQIGPARARPIPFTDKYIFPGYHLPSLSQMLSGKRGGAADRQRRRDAAAALCLYAAGTGWSGRAPRGPRSRRCTTSASIRMWEFYLAGGIVMFENGAGCNYQVQYIRDRRALPITRDYMAEAEAKYRAKG